MAEPQRGERKWSQDRLWLHWKRIGEPQRGEAGRCAHTVRGTRVQCELPRGHTGDHVAPSPVADRPVEGEAARLVRNAAECAKCGTIIESKHRHDWVQCECGAIFIDGGLAYQRGGGSLEHFIDRSEWRG